MKKVFFRCHINLWILTSFIHLQLSKIALTLELRILVFCSFPAFHIFIVLSLMDHSVEPQSTWIYSLKLLIPSQVLVNSLISTRQFLHH